MRWNLREYLPPLTHQFFDLLVAEFVLESFRLTQRQRAVGHVPAPVAGAGGPGEGAADGADADVDTAGGAGPMVDQLRALVRQRVAQRLLKAVADLQRQLSDLGVTGGSMGTGGAPADDDVDRAAAAFPKLAGSHLTLTHPVLEFVKSVVHVLQLDPRVTTEAQVVRRNALALMGMREFASETTFHDPCLSFKLSDVVCNFCQYCQDMDLGRDSADLLNADGVWVCRACSSEYNRAAIEETLIALLQRRSVAYQLQDLRCPKCHAVQAGNLGDYCRCSGRFITTEDPKAMASSLRVFRHLAQFYKFDLLLELVNWMLLRT
jgi:DNA polymerase epsilon subunit 1